MKTTFTGILLLIFCATSSLFAQQKSTSSLLGHGFDIRFIDPLDLHASSLGKALVKGSSTSVPANSPAKTSVHYITSAQEYEKEVLLADDDALPFSAVESRAFYMPLLDSTVTDLLFVYVKNRQNNTIQSFSKIAQLDSALVADFIRLGRDITPAGFVSRYGTHYAHKEVRGGLFVQRSLVTNDDFVYSPYDEKQFKETLEKILIVTGTINQYEDAYITPESTTYFSQGGDTQATSVLDWQKSVSAKEATIEVQLISYADLLKDYPIAGISDKASKIAALDSIIKVRTNEAKSKLAKPRTSVFFKKYSIQFKQQLNTIVKNSTGKAGDEDDYTGDLFFGGYSKDDAILKIRPLADFGGLSLETLITDEVVKINKNIILTVAPADFERGYVNVWDDTKKLQKSADRTTLRVSGKPENRIYFKDALRQVVTKDIELTSIDNDVYDINYSLEILKEESLMLNPTVSYNYVLDTEMVSAAATGDLDRLLELFLQNGNAGAPGMLNAAIVNGQPIEVLNFILDYGVIPTTDDLDTAFAKAYFKEQTVLTLLERGAEPKNNMIYKAVAYKSAPTIYALFREGASPMNNDLAFALKQYHYPTIKALMSEDYEPFLAGKNELLLAAENNDPDLAQQFISLGATADAYILDKATSQNNVVLKDLIIPVTEATGGALEVAAKIDDTKLFDYFVKKEAKIETNKAAELATDNNNTDILDLALKNGGEANEALEYAIVKENKPAMRVSLENKAKADPVFAYATRVNDELLFEEALVKYNGDPEIALKEAVKNDKIPLAQKVIDTRKTEVDASNVINEAIDNDNLAMVEMLVDNNADPSKGITQAVKTESLQITSYLINKGAGTSAPELLQNAVQNQNLGLSKILIEQGQANASDAIVDAAKSENLEITEFLLDKGATPEEALKESMETTNEDIILALLNRVETVEQRFMSTAARKGNLRVVKVLLDRGLSPKKAIDDAIRYKNPKVLAVLIENGATPSMRSLENSINSNFIEGIQMCVASGVSVSEPFSDGRYPIHIISQNYQETDIALLDFIIESGAAINAKNKLGETALHIAALGGKDNLPLAEKLVALGIDIEAKSQEKKTAQEYTDDRSMKLFIKKAAKK